jgi:hypothetical protein
VTTIKLQSNSMSARAFAEAKTGDVFHLLIHELRYPPEIRANPPRVRLLEDAHVGHTLCELVDPWPDAPEYWPPWSAPGDVLVARALGTAAASAAPAAAAPPAKPPPRKRAKAPKAPTP